MYNFMGTCSVSILFVQVEFLLGIYQEGHYHILQLGSSFVWLESIAEIANSFLRPEAFEVVVFYEAQLPS
jgi:hypothetical protein